MYLIHEGRQAEGTGSITLAIASLVLVLVFLTRGKRHAGDRAGTADR